MVVSDDKENKLSIHASENLHVFATEMIKKFIYRMYCNTCVIFLYSYCLKQNVLVQIKEKVQSWHFALTFLQNCCAE